MTVKEACRSRVSRESGQGRLSLRRPVKGKQRLLVSSCAVMALIGLATGTVSVVPVHGEEYEINQAVEETNGGNALDDGDTLTVTEDGEVNVDTTGQAMDAYGIYAEDGSFTIINLGGITVQGDVGYFAAGIEVKSFDGDDDIRIENSGSIETVSDHAAGYGISVSTAGGNNSIYVGNSGTISALRSNGDESSGKAMGVNINASSGEDTITVDNSGSISATTYGTADVDDEVAWGIQVNANAGEDQILITNSGTITAATTEGNSVGLYVNGGGDADVVDVTNSGSIVLDDFSGHGLVVYGGGGNDLLTIDNSGSIAINNAANGYSRGINLHGGSGADTISISNSGSIRIFDVDTDIYDLDEDIYGIWADGDDGDDELTITNSGSIEVAGTGDDDVGSVIGIYAISTDGNDSMEIFNSGSIEISSDTGHAYGIHVSVGADNDQVGIDNNGTITAYSADTDAWGIYVDGDAGEDVISITNTSNDSILVNSNTGDAYGIAAVGGENDDVIEITNSGRIETDSEEGASTGIVADGGDGTDALTITNSGTVISRRGTAIRFIDGEDNTLNLDSSSTIIGSIDFGDNGAVINLSNSGPTHSIHWDFSGDVLGITDPSGLWFYDEVNQGVATYDPSGFAGTWNTLGDMTRLLSGVGRSGVDVEEGRQLWGSVFGGSMEHDGDGQLTLDQDVDQAGIAVGGNGIELGGMYLGVMAGYIATEEASASSYADSHEIDSDGFFLGLHGVQYFGRLTFDYGVTTGLLSHDSSRFVQENTAQDASGDYTGSGWATASYDSWFVSPEVGVRMDIPAGDSLVFTPSARLRYAMQTIDDYQEKGTDADAVVDERDLGMFEAAVELAAVKKTGMGDVAGRLGYLVRDSTGDDETSVTMINDTNLVDYGELENDGAYVGLSYDVELGRRASLVLDGEYQFGGDASGFQGLAKLTFSF